MSNLTVAQLKEELRRNGVTFEEGKLKKYYVDLHGNLKSAPAAVGFSDDESQAIDSSPRRRRSLVRTRPPTTPPKSSEDVSGMDDTQLRSQLQKHGHTPGPITDTTRGLYRRMLSDSVSPGPGTPKKGTPKKSASAPGTPAKKTPKRQQAAAAMAVSDDETTDGAVADVGAKASSKLTRAPTSARRRSEIDRLRLDNPGPQMAQSVPRSESGVNLRSRRSDVEGTGAASEVHSQSEEEKSACAISCKPAFANNFQLAIMLGIFVLMAFSVIFAMRCGLPGKLPLPKK